MNEPLLNSVALLVLDVQDAFLKAIPEGDRLLSRCSFAVEAARILGIRTYFTTQVPDKLGDLNPHLQSLAGDAPVYPKTAFSALQAPDLRQKLAEAEIDHLLVAGLEIPICVYQTALEAVNDELSVTLLTDCIGGRRAADRTPVLNALAQVGCHLLPSETVFYSILGDAKHPAFRDFTKLVKKYSDERLPAS